MNKLGFAIKVVSDGVYEPLVCNKGSWFKKVIDPRHYLRMFSGLVGTENVVTAMSFSEYGCYIMLLRDIPGHAGDCLSAWLFIPCNVDIDDEQVMRAYHYAKSILAQSSIEAIEYEAYDFFDKEYPVKSYCSQYAPSIGEKLGLRFVNGEGELSELLGKKRYQEYYSQFKAVFILDRNAEIQVNAEGASFFGDLTKQPLEEYCVLVSPTASELSVMGQGAKVVFRNGKTFDSPLFVKKGSWVELYACRDSFEDVALKPITIDTDVVPFPHVGYLNWKKTISKSFFDIRNHDGKKVEADKIIVEGYDVVQQQVSLPEEECRHAKVQISAFKYETWEATVDFINHHEKQKITLHRAEGQANYAIILANGKEAEMTLKSKYFDGLGESPLEGYSCDGRTLYASFGYKIKYWFYGLLSAIVLAILIAGFTAFDSYMDNKEFQFGWPPIVEKKVIPLDDAEVETPDSIGAITYLNEHEKWSKAVMDTLPELPAGMYDCLKQYRFEDLTKMSIDCEQFNKIKEVALKAIENGVQMSDDYNDSPDSTITIKNWIKTVNRVIEKKSTVDASSADIEPVEDISKEVSPLESKVKANKQKAKVVSSKSNSKGVLKKNTEAKSISKSAPKNSSESNKNGGL